MQLNCRFILSIGTIASLTDPAFVGTKRGRAM